MNADFCSNTELLQYVADNGIIDLTYVRDQIEMKKKEELLTKTSHTDVVC